MVIDPQLDRRVVLVTDGATGIGAAIVRAFAAQGARVAVHYLAEDLTAPDEVTWKHKTPAADKAEQLADELDTPAVAIAANLFEPSEIERLFNTVETQLGPVDVLVNNAAHCESPDTIDTITASGLERHYRVNAIAPAVLIRELAHRVRRGRRSNGDTGSTEPTLACLNCVDRRVSRCSTSPDLPQSAGGHVCAPSALISG